MFLRTPFATLILPALLGTSHAVVTFTETFDGGANGWLTGTSVAPVHSTTGGIGDSGHISFTSNASGGSMGGTYLAFRANDASNASGDAFVGNWLAPGATVSSFSVAVRHNGPEAVDFYLRIAASAPPGAGGSLATGYTIAPNTWTTITFDITNSNPPFQSFGSSNFNAVFSAVQNMQLGAFLPAGTIDNFTMDLDNVTITVVPEPASLGLLGLGTLALVGRRRR